MKLEIYWKYCEKRRNLLDFHVKTGTRFSTQAKRLFEISEVAITGVDCSLATLNRWHGQLSDMICHCTFVKRVPDVFTAFNLPRLVDEETDFPLWFKPATFCTADTHSHPLRKHAYSNILKISPPKTESFEIKILIFFFIFLLKT